MRNALIASSIALLGLAAVPARAMPFPPPADAPPGVTLVAMGCGPGWTRGPYGHCHPIGVAAPVVGVGVAAPVVGIGVAVPAPVYVGPRYGRRCWRGPYGGLHCAW
jgi:hypothetical protein